MFRIPLLFLVAYFFGCNISEAQLTNPAMKSINDQCKLIRKNIASFDTAYIEIPDQSTEGGYGTAYYEGKRLKLIVVMLYGETGEKRVEYYFDRGGVFFALAKEDTYNRPYYWDSTTAAQNGDTEYFDPAKSTFAEARYYFLGEELLGWVNNGVEVHLTLEDKVDVANEVIGYANELKSKFNR